MNIDKKVIDRLTELIDRGEDVAKSLKTYPDSAYSFDHQTAIQWKVSSMSFLTQVFGGDSLYIKQFLENFNLNNLNALVSF